MSTTRIFKDYFNHLMEYQNQLLPDNKLNKDYIIIYDYLMDLLQKNEFIAELLVRKKQTTSNINADILLDLTKLFNTSSSIHNEPFVRLTLKGFNNKRFAKKPQHPFCNKNKSIIATKITNIIWLALHKGLSEYGSFVRGYHGDIYELSLCSEDYNEFNVLRINAYNDDASININLRILLKYINSNNIAKERSNIKMYPITDLNKKWLALVPRRHCSMFEICLPKLENEMKKSCFKLIMVLRLFRFLFEKHKILCHLDMDFLEAIVYSEYVEIMHGDIKKDKYHYDYISKGVFTRIYHALKNKNSLCFWNVHLNLIKCFKERLLISKIYHDFNIIYTNFNKLKNKESLSYEEFFQFFDFKMDPFTYEVDQFGIFKSY